MPSCLIVAMEGVSPKFNDWEECPNVFGSIVCVMHSVHYLELLERIVYSVD